MMENINTEEKDSALTAALLDMFSKQLKPIKTLDILVRLQNNYQLFVKGRDVRRVIGQIRKKDLLSPGFIVSNVNTGYWLSTDAKEQKTFVEQQLNRMANQFENIQTLHVRIIEDLGKKESLQFNLF